MQSITENESFSVRAQSLESMCLEFVKTGCLADYGDVSGDMKQNFQSSWAQVDVRKHIEAVASLYHEQNQAFSENRQCENTKAGTLQPVEGSHMHQQFRKERSAPMYNDLDENPSCHNSIEGSDRYFMMHAENEYRVPVIERVNQKTDESSLESFENQCIWQELNEECQSQNHFIATGYDEPYQCRMLTSPTGVCEYHHADVNMHNHFANGDSDNTMISLSSSKRKKYRKIRRRRQKERAFMRQFIEEQERERESFVKFWKKQYEDSSRSLKSKDTQCFGTLIWILSTPFTR